MVQGWRQRYIDVMYVAGFFPEMKLLQLVGKVDIRHLWSFRAKRSKRGVDLPAVQVYWPEMLQLNVGQLEVDAWRIGSDKSTPLNIHTFLREEYNRFFPEDLGTPWTYKEDIREGIWERMELLEKQREKKMALNSYGDSKECEAEDHV